MKYIPTAIIRLNCNHEGKSLQERPPGGLLEMARWCERPSGLPVDVQTFVQYSARSCAVVVADRPFPLLAAVWLPLELLRPTAESCDWPSSFCFCLCRSWGQGGRWDLPALCWSCCTSRCPRVREWSQRGAQVFILHPVKVWCVLITWNKVCM